MHDVILREIHPVLQLQDVEHVDLSQRPFLLRGSETEVRAHSIIIATGATAKRLGIPSEETFWSNGISACAICDGAFCHDAAVAADSMHCEPHVVTWLKTFCSVHDSLWTMSDMRRHVHNDG